ncbi:biotin synthase BioB [Desulfonatronospira sp.]|uniref:biotin synthase BioB n=1 Tax=Desulfonatronospira sp. TaxID=1962951 RepID=UPI0025BDD9D9|nr:biotin synthase BioB [Desulfonatronospira sp.]
MQYFLDLAIKTAQGNTLSDSEQRVLLDLPYSETYRLFPGSELLRRNFAGFRVKLCSITNAKSGKCTEDCAFCAQSAHHSTHISHYPLRDSRELGFEGRDMASLGVSRFSLVTSGRSLSADEIQRVAQTVKDISSQGIYPCASLGVLEKEHLQTLKDAGLKRYHHNLETAPGYFSAICSTHGYSQRLDTVRLAGQTGLSVCSGAVFGMGETDAHVLELALVLRELQVDAVPVNFLVPIPGTPLENYNELTPLRCLKIICMLRFMLPRQEIIICGGRLENLGELHPLVFMAGASGLMTGNYLTRKGRGVHQDLELIRNLGLEPV